MYAIRSYYVLAKRETMDDEDFAAAYAQALDKYRELCTKEKQAVLESGGLYILGTERHESRRVITSYSIHYTKLYDASCSHRRGLTLGLLVRPVPCCQ